MNLQIKQTTASLGCLCYRPEKFQARNPCGLQGLIEVDSKIFRDFASSNFGSLKPSTVGVFTPGNWQVLSIHQGFLFLIEKRTSLPEHHCSDCSQEGMWLWLCPWSEDIGEIEIKGFYMGKKEASNKSWSIIKSS